jgi:hypothetical protein
MQEAHNGKVTSMAAQRREESERRSKRQGSGIRKEGGDEFKASPTRGRIKEEIFLCKNVGDESQVDFRKDSQRPEQQD